MWKKDRENERKRKSKRIGTIRPYLVRKHNYKRHLITIDEAGLNFTIFLKNE